MSINLKEFLFLNSKEIFTDIKSNLEEDKKIKLHMEEEFNKIEDDTELQVFIEMILDNYINRQFGFKEKLKNQISLREFMYSFKGFKKRVFKIIEMTEYDLYEKNKLFVEFNEFTDKLEMLK